MKITRWRDLLLYLLFGCGVLVVAAIYEVDRRSQQHVAIMTFVWTLIVVSTLFCGAWMGCRKKVGRYFELKRQRRKESRLREKSNRFPE